MSSDAFLGTPYNVASYALLTHMFADVLGLGVGELVYHGVDVHLYENHVEQAKIQLTRQEFDLPKLKIYGRHKSVLDFKPDDFELINYKHHPHIKAPVAV